MGETLCGAKDETRGQGGRDHGGRGDVVVAARRAGLELKRAKACDVQLLLRREREDRRQHSLHGGGGCALRSAGAHVTLHPADKLLLIHLS